MKKIIVKVVGLNGDREKRKAMKAVSTLQGISQLSVDTKDEKLTVVGDVDPVCVTTKLRRKWQFVQLDSVEEEKKPGEKKPEDKKPDDKKPDDKDINKQVAELVEAYKNYNPCMTKYYLVHSIEENPNACAIC